MDDEVGSFGSVIFEVWGDNTRLYASNTLTGTSATASVSVDVSGRAQLRLVVLAGADINSDHADWADAKLVCNGSAPIASIINPVTHILPGELITGTATPTSEHAAGRVEVEQHSLRSDAAPSVPIADADAIVDAKSRRRRMPDQT